MPSKEAKMPGYVYKTAAIRKEDYIALEAMAEALRLPITQAIGLCVGATGPNMAAIVKEQQDLAAKIIRRRHQRRQSAPTTESAE